MNNSGLDFCHRNRRERLETDRPHIEMFLEVLRDFKHKGFAIMGLIDDG